MAPKTKKTANKKTVSVAEHNFESISTPAVGSVNKSSILPFPISFKVIVILLLIVGLAVIAFYKKSWFVAATVNNMPITNFELLNRMNQQYREQTLSQMINERVLTNEASKQRITMSSDEIQSKLAEIEKNVGGPEALDGLLKQQNQTLDSLKDQIRFQLIIEKLYQNEATVSAQEVQTYISQNKDQLTASGSAEQAKEAEDALKQQKLGQIFNQKFPELKQNANIKTF